jgi:integrase
MASIYTKNGSKLIWIRYKDAAGVWRGKPSGYSTENFGERRQAELLARRQSEIEKTRAQNVGAAFEDWVLPWIVMKYGGTQNTLNAYRGHWQKLAKFCAHADIHFAPQIRREFAQQYLAWRTDETGGAGRNTAIQEIKFMGMVLEEGIPRGFCDTNPLRKLGMKKDRSLGKELWTDEQIRVVQAHIEKTKTLWQRVTFYFGLYQACRLRQCQVPLAGIRLNIGTIQYPDVVVKGGEAYSQPIDPRFLPILEELLHTAKKANMKRLCDVKWDASLIWRTTLDRCGFQHISHHGLRATWITRAAESDVPEGLAMAFCHHSNAEVHRVYKKISVSAIAHIPASVPLPSFGALLPGRRAEGAPPAMPDNVGSASVSQTPLRNRDRVRNRRRFANARPPKIAPVPPSEAE